EKKTPMRLPISQSVISSRCGTRLHRKHLAQKRSSITRSKPCCLESICRFTPWSLSREYLTQRQRNGRGRKTHWCMRVYSCSRRFQLPRCSGFSRAKCAPTPEPELHCRKSGKAIIFAACFRNTSQPSS